MDVVGVVAILANGGGSGDDWGEWGAVARASVVGDVNRVDDGGDGGILDGGGLLVIAYTEVNDLCTYNSMYVSEKCTVCTD